MAGREVDLLVIGGGSGGVRAARVAAGHGARVLVAEESRLGGTCVIRGCVPKKLMVYASRFADEIEDAAGFGWSIEGARFDWGVLKANRDREIARLERVYGALLQTAGVDVAAERAVVEGPNAVRLVGSGEVVWAGRILVAVGARPSTEGRIPGAGLSITSDDVFELERRPERILVVGGGYIAVEFAGVFAGLGSQVTLLHRGEKLLRGFDEDLRDALGEAYAKRGIALELGRTLDRLERDGDRLRATLSDGRELVVDQVLNATGRFPHTKGLGLESAGIVLDPIAGAVPVDRHSRTVAPTIYAIGDVTNRANLTPVAIREGHAFADSIFGSKPTVVDHSLIATAVFSTPEVATVGLSEEMARAERGEDVVIFKASFRPMKATLSGRDERTLMKVVVDGPSDRVLGVHLVGHDSGEMIQLAAVAMTCGATKADFDRTIAVHPTAAEELVTMRTPFVTKRSLAAG